MQDLTLLLSSQPDPTGPSRDCQALPSACGVLEPAGEPVLPSLCLCPEGSRAAQARRAQHGALSCCHSPSGWKDISGF